MKSVNTATARRGLLAVEAPDDTSRIEFSLARTPGRNTPLDREATAPRKTCDHSRILGFAECLVSLSRVSNLVSKAVRSRLLLSRGQLLRGHRRRSAALATVLCEA